MSSCKKSKCGCSDEPATTYNGLCNEIDCASPPACEEYFPMQCIVLDGYGIHDVFADANASLLEVIQRLIIQVNNPSCMAGGSCGSTPLLYPTEITDEEISIWWKPVPSATSYEVNYKTIGSGIWIPLSSQTTNTATIPNLTDDTAYHVKVITGCASGGPCDSVTLTITTKES